MKIKELIKRPEKKVSPNILFLKDFPHRLFFFSLSSILQPITHLLGTISGNLNGRAMVAAGLLRVFEIEKSTETYLV